MMKPMQAGGLLQIWQNPKGSYHHLFLKLDLDCEPEDYPGVLIVSDVHHRQVLVTAVESLHKELHSLLQKIEGEGVACWKREQKAQERSKILSDLTANPVFVG